VLGWGGGGVLNPQIYVREGDGGRIGNEYRMKFATNKSSRPRLSEQRSTKISYLVGLDARVTYEQRVQ
jgi:hypothetical protein